MIIISRSYEDLVNIVSDLRKFVSSSTCSLCIALFVVNRSISSVGRASC